MPAGGFHGGGFGGMPAGGFHGGMPFFPHGGVPFHGMPFHNVYHHGYDHDYAYGFLPFFDYGYDGYPYYSDNGYSCDHLVRIGTPHHYRYVHQYTCS